MKLSRRKFAQLSGFAGLALVTESLLPAPLKNAADFFSLEADPIEKSKTAKEIVLELKKGWNNPASTYKPHTRWWWPGNAVTREGIDFQLEQMKMKGFGGVEIMSWMKIYEKGNLEFDSPEFIEMVKHTVNKCRELGMEVSLSLGPGWGLGGSEVKEENRSKSLVFSEQELEGGRAVEFTLELPQNPPYAVKAKKRLEAVIAVKLKDDRTPDPSQRMDLSNSVKGERKFSSDPKYVVQNMFPSGNWRVLSFWTALTSQKCAGENYEPRTWLVDHLKKDAVREHVTYMGTRFRTAFGSDFGKTVDSFFGDSFELEQDFSLWSDGLFDRFQREKGYDLRPYLPLLLYDGAPETPYVRYDFGQFLHKMGMEGTIVELSDYCEKAGIHMRQQPHYRFTVELIEASGVLQRPETEFSRRSFDPNAYPHKLTTSGAWLYPSKQKRWVSCEAFTFVNLKYRTSMEEIKRATDLFLRDGITQFYNHGYFYSPEKELEPARDLLYMNRISHVNTWWPYYRGLADYQARAAFLNRQGKAKANVLLYSPMPTVWSERAEFPVKHVRDLPFGGLPKILVASGYDFDCVNDDLLQNYTQIKDGKICINGYQYSVLILPRVICLSTATLKVVEKFVLNGGIVFALNTLPSISTGLMDFHENDKLLHHLSSSLFNEHGGAKRTGKGTTYFLPQCDSFEYLTEWKPSSVEWEPTPPLNEAYKEFIQDLRHHLIPDFEIEGQSLSNGLTFRHSAIDDVDCWFICNLQPNRQQSSITLNSLNKVPQVWNAMTGNILNLSEYHFAGDGRIILPISLEPWESIFVLLTPEKENLETAKGISANEKSITLTGKWNVNFKGLGNSRASLLMDTLTDWTKIKNLENFSGSATYSLEFDLPDNPREFGKVEIDLGIVHEVAAVRLNGKQAGTVWMQPYRLDISGQAKQGINKLEIDVVNLLWNYAVGLEKPTPIPIDLQEHYGTTWDQKYNAWNGLQLAKKIKKDDRLPSGLIGPVKLNLYKVG